MIDEEMPRTSDAMSPIQRGTGIRDVDAGELAIEPVRARLFSRVFEPSPRRLDQLGAWFASEYRSLLRFAYLLTGSQAAAEDLVQDAFLRIYRAGGNVDHAGIRAYARRTLVNAERSAIRRRTLERKHLHLEPQSAEPDLVGYADLRAALRGLRPRQRACVILRFYEDLNEREIADVVGITPAAARKQVQRGLAKLREAMKEEL